jgi:flagellar motor protein MotB
MDASYLLRHNDHMLLWGIAALFLLGLLSAFWPRSADQQKPVRGNLLTSLGAVLGVLVLFFTISGDKRSTQETQARLASSEHDREQLEAKLASMGVEEAQYQKLLAQSDNERLRATEEAQHLREGLLVAASTVADTSDPRNIKIKEAVLFDTGQATLSCASREKLGRLVGFLTASLLGRPSQIYVEGHTDNRDHGGKYNNQELSDKRANAVRDYLINAGFPKDMIRATGHAEHRPYGTYTDQDKETVIEKNKTTDLQRQNRRVEIMLGD